MSPEVVSQHPDRPIRPLPKRSLRERLPPDVADSIQYPPAPATQPPLFYYPYNIREDVAAGSLVESSHPSERPQAEHPEQNYIPRRNGGEPESDEEETAYRTRVYSRPAVFDSSGRSYRYVQKSEPRQPNPHPPGSTASSADGYDSFENTNNKKKRKIPTPGDSNINGAHLSGDLAGMGISGPEDSLDDSGNGAGYYHGGGSAAQGLSGPGRGRYGRNRNGRSPLRTLSDVSGNWGNGRNPKQRPPQWPTTSKHFRMNSTLMGKEVSLTLITIDDGAGIISTAIANAEKSPITPSQGQENISLLQQASKKQNPASTQFTFTFDSQVPATVPWPSPNVHHGPAGSMSTHGTQTSPSMPGPPASQARQGQTQQSAQAQRQNGPQSAPPKRTRRSAAKEYQIAARQRRQKQEYQNMTHPPNPEDIWICEFCEYESIFGTPPEALIKQYEIKDRRLRKQEAERKRLLEKAKMKGRKGKKGSKGAAKASAQDRQAHQQSSQQSIPLEQNPSQGTQSEDYPEDEYEQDYGQDDPSSPGIPPSARHQDAVQMDSGQGGPGQAGGTGGGGGGGRRVT
ncbi:hypothetical protein CJF31_00007929 [Rutstroemia sp. NJR-2017a BVV2]|nr:hypothetical protein CJF31_00007929 [Rutstroemia sp. NJR-2017a BVV2]